MINNIIVFLLVFTAGLLSSVMDTLKDHYSSSIWWEKTLFWPTQQDAKGKKFLGIMVLDAWHLAKTAWIILMCAPAVIHNNLAWWNVLTLYFLAHGGGFGLGYNWLFKKK